MPECREGDHPMWKGLIVSAALIAGNPTEQPGLYRNGTFCSSLELIEFAVELAQEGAHGKIIVEAINDQLGPRTCFFTTARSMYTGPLVFEKRIPFNNEHAIYSTFVYGVVHRVAYEGKLIEVSENVSATFYTVQLLQKEDTAAR